VTKSEGKGRTRQCHALGPQGDPRTGPRPIRGRLSVNKLTAVEGHLQKGQPVLSVTRMPTRLK
jgi:hypothetical protein